MSTATRPPRRRSTAARWLRDLAFPRHNARTVPLGRVAIVTVIAASLTFVAFQLIEMRVPLPFVSSRYHIHAELAYADGLAADNYPPVSVAGVPEGTVTGVHYETTGPDKGKALIDMTLFPSARDRIYSNATLQVRPINPLNMLAVDILPGTRAAGVLREGGTIPASQTQIPVASDQLLDIFNADTRAYLVALTQEGAIALHGRGGALAQMLSEIGQAANPISQVGIELAQHRQLLTQLVGDMTTLFQTLAHRRVELTSLFASSTRLLAVSGARQQQLAGLVQGLPGLLDSIRSASNAITQASAPVEQALPELTPATEAFDRALHEVAPTIPAANRLLSATRQLVYGNRTAAAQLVSFLRRLKPEVPVIERAIAPLSQLATLLVPKASLLTTLATDLSGVASVQDQVSPEARLMLLGFTVPTPQDFGLTASSAAARPGKSGYSPLENRLATALTALCQNNDPLACWARFEIPGLPGSLAKTNPAASDGSGR